MKRFEGLLSGGDLRSLGASRSLISRINNQTDFDALFEYLFHSDRLVVMRAADVIEKITIKHPHYFNKHKKRILELSLTAANKELQWHLAQFIPRLSLTGAELGKVWAVLTEWAKDKKNSKIVRVNALQALFDLAKKKISLMKDFNLTLSQLEKENIPSINARIRKLRK
jgi:hypothetical protein